MGSAINTVAFPAPVLDKRFYQDELLRRRDLVWLKTQQDEKIPCCYVRAQRSSSFLSSPNLTILYSHGNAEDLGLHLDYIDALAHFTGCDVLSYEYVGYSLSRLEGDTASEAACLRSIDAAWRYLVDDQKILPKRIVIFGRSIGSGPSVDLASRATVEGSAHSPLDAAGVILQSPLESGARAVLGNTVSIIGYYLDIFRNYEKISNIRAPVAIMHGTEDEVVPVKNGEAMSDLMARYSDSEVELLTDAPVARWSFPKAAAVILGGVGVLGVAAAGFKGSKGLRSKSGSFVGLEGLDEVSNCFAQGMFYTSPHKMDGTERSVEFSAEACQTRCQVVPECSHFTFWPDGGCLLTGEESSVKAAPFKFSATVTGPKFCAEAVEAAQDAITAAGDAASGLVQPVADATSGLVQPVAEAASTVHGGWPDSSDVADATSGLVQPAADAAANAANAVTSQVQDAKSSWGASIQQAADSVSSGVQQASGAVSDAANGAVDAANGALGAATEAVQKVVATVGVNGTACSAYPACVSVGITEGDCCPNTDKVSLGCCAGFPKEVLEVKIAPGSECSMFPQCMALNITGACCPTPEGVKLGCCGEI
ncbi:unnamed protein product [Effrenium voratum]|nr:unnamed protein product [Effrenium voratum]